ncbi:dsDNA nuclease domain-containing protein [Vibrio olivae]|uniref:DsDNA nuclease domain-containing protein n=1 Tax=Vibrio olivae TaxID=1243002 RepID=A0ABV5HHB8_9VIBR
MADNPLAETQRESAGASTFGKYNFQFHWALCEIIEKHKNKKEYALLIEHHEDVVIADSLDAEEAQFEFYQVKNQKAKYTPASLTNRQKGANDTLKNSVLGKLLSSCINTTYEDRITTIGLVSSSGFSLNLDKGLKLDVIKVGDIAASDLASLTQDISCHCSPR